VIPSSGVPVSARMRPNDAYFELISDTLEALDPGVRSQFLQRFFFSLAHLEVQENQANHLWEQILARRAQLSDRAESPIAMQTALVDVLVSAGFFHVPIILEYDDLKNLHRSAVTDPLTGLNNRRLFNETFDKELNRARRYAQPLSLVTLDLHRFKEVNDLYGHPRGDEVLRATAATLRKALRTSDSAFRIGGDEFALLLPQTDSSQASALSRRIGVAFAEMLRPLHLSISVSMDHGLSTYPQDADQRDPLIRIADERLYRSKYASHERSDAEPSQGSSYQAAAPVAVKPPIVSDRPAQASSEPTSDQSPAELAPSDATAVSLPTDSVLHPEIASEAVPPSDTPTAPVLEPPPPPPPSPATLVSPLQSSQPTFPVVTEAPRLYTVPRKAERVSMAGTNAYAVLADQSSNRARVVDLGFGGVALDFPSQRSIPETLLAVLHVPILPPVRVSLKRVWTKQLSEDTVRVGCCFVS
jgi:diguanylate cyclase (GGDEF)-like protein